MPDNNENDKPRLNETIVMKHRSSFGTKTRFIWLSDRSMSTEPKIIEFQKVTLMNQEEPVFSMLDFDVHKNEKMAIIGESGSGKSQLLFLCAGLIAANEGLILVNGIDPANGKYDDVSRVRRRIGLVFQEGVIINNMSIYDNIALPLRYHSVFDEKDVEKKVDLAVRKFKLEKYVAKRPSEVSVGIRRLTAYARAFAIEPLIYLIDEPFVDFDAKRISLVTNFFEELKYEKNTTVLMTSSNEMLIKPFVDRIMYIDNSSIVNRSEL